MAEFRCPSCGGNCCTCGGCQPAVTTRGKQACSRCILGVQRVEDSEYQLAQLRVQEQQHRPNERLYENNVGR